MRLIQKIEAMDPNEKIILALDTPTGQDALTLLNRLDQEIRNVKVGPVLFIREGPSFIEKLHHNGYRVFLDLKLHDIPNTVALGVRAARALGVWLLSVHLSGGTVMLEGALREAQGKLLLAGITVLTSLNDSQIKEIGLSESVEEQVKKLARLAVRVGLHAIVASPKEVRALRALVGNKALLIAPGIRMEDSPPDDQSRAMTPREAIEAGADYLIVGRPILQAKNPKETLASIAASIKEGAGHER